MNQKDRDVIAIIDGMTKDTPSAGATLTPEIHAAGMRHLLATHGEIFVSLVCIFCGELQPSLKAFISHLEGHPDKVGSSD